MAVEVSNPCQDLVLFDFDFNVWPHLDLRYTGLKHMNNRHTSQTYKEKRNVYRRFDWKSTGTILLQDIVRTDVCCRVMQVSSLPRAKQTRHWVTSLKRLVRLTCGWASQPSSLRAIPQGHKATKNEIQSKLTVKSKYFVSRHNTFKTMK